MPGLSYSRKDGKELQTYHYNAELGINELPFVSDTIVDGSAVPGPGDRTQAALIDCSSLSAGRTKYLRIAGGDSGSQSIMLNMWFADTKDELEKAVATGNPAQIPVFGGSIDIELPVSSSWFAIDYDIALSGEISPASFLMTIVIA